MDIKQVLYFPFLLILSVLSLNSVANEKVTIAVSKTPLSAAFFVAQEQGYFSELGLDVSFIPLNGGHRTMKAMLEGKADFATSSDMVMMNAAKNNQDFKVAATFSLSSLDTMLVANRQSGVTSSQELKGKKIGLTLGTAAHYFLDTYLLLSGVEVNQVEYINLQPEMMLEQLSSNQVDAVVTWEPWISRVQAGLGKDRVDLKDVLAYTLSFNLVASQAVSQSDSGSTEKILAALIKAEKYIAESPNQAQTMVADAIESDLNYLQEVWSKYQYRVSLDQSLVLLLESELKWSSMANQKEHQFINFLDFIWLSPLKRVDSQRVTVIH